MTQLLDPDELQHWREEIALVHDACGRFDLKAFREGTLSPVYFGSALRNFGVRDLLDALIAYAPPPLSRKAATRTVEATEPAMTGIIFKIQANMDPNHRDRIAFMRVCSGRLTRGMKVKHVRTDKTMALPAPQFFFAQDRSLAEEAYAGDVVGIPNRGTLRIGDALTEGEDIQFLGIPSFAPEILRRIRLEDAIRAKKLRDALREMAEEGVVQLFSPLDGTQPIVGVIGALQLDVLGDRLTHEYGLQIGFDPAPCELLRWITSEDPAALTRFIETNRSSIATDSEGDYVYLAASVFSLSWVEERNPGDRVHRHQICHSVLTAASTSRTMSGGWRRACVQRRSGSCSSSAKKTLHQHVLVVAESGIEQLDLRSSMGSRASDSLSLAQKRRIKITARDKCGRRQVVELWRGFWCGPHCGAGPARHPRRPWWRRSSHR